MGQTELPSVGGRLKFVTKQLGRPLLQTAARSWARYWPPYSRLSLVSDAATCVLDWERRELAAIATALNTL